MQISFSTPERCLLVQAAHWFIDGILPLPDEVYLRAPIELKAENSELRGLFIALLAEDCDLRGDLVMENPKKLGPHEEKKSNYTPPTSIFRDTKVGLDTVSLNAIDFANSKIKTAYWVIAETAGKEIKKQRQRHPSEVSWPGKFFYQHVTVDFSKLGVLLSSAKESANPPAKRGAPAKYNWDLIWAELVVRADLDNLPSTQAECIRDISQWCGDRFGDAPGDTRLKEKLKLVYRHHRKVSK